MPTTDLERMTLSVKAVIGLLVTVVGVAAYGLREQGTLATNQLIIKSNLDALTSEVKDLKVDVKGLSKIGDIEAKLTMLQTRGSDAVQDVARELSGFKQSIEAFRNNGSPGEVKRMEALENRVAELEKKLQVHEALDEKRMGNRP